jgi:hypothetical protein
VNAPKAGTVYMKFSSVAITGSGTMHHLARIAPATRSVQKAASAVTKKGSYRQRAAAQMTATAATTAVRLDVVP